MSITLPRITFTLLAAVGLALPAGIASADDADKAACVDLEEGDDCTRGDGGPGTCIPDESDANVLTCDDDGAGGSGGDDGGGCSVSGQDPSSALPLLALGLGAVLVRRRRRA
ncbi:MAG: MYXO-CTERM sorting domain-containing protein [Polyangiaceae bacterium]